MMYADFVSSLVCFDLNALFLESVFQPYFREYQLSAITLIDLSYSLLNITNLVLVFIITINYSFYHKKYLKLYHTCS
jgi:hypothetical protein